MMACACALVATWMKLAQVVDQVVPEMSVPVCQLYPSDSDPPGKRRKPTPISLSAFEVEVESRSLSHTAVLTPNQRASAVRTVWVALTLRWTRAGACLAVSATSSM